MNTESADAAARSFLILHGWQNHRPEGHWEHWLARELTRLGHRVHYPQLPDPDDPDLDTWLAELERHLAALREGGTRPTNDSGERVVVCHSLAVLLWLHAIARSTPDIDVDRVLLVSPPSGPVTAQYPEIAGFALSEPARSGPAGTRIRLVAGDNDPYCPEGAAVVYGGPLGLDTDVVPGGAHLDLEAGYGPWPSVLAWCLDPSVRVTGRVAGGPE
ncbi:alpha/beta hydrolase [Streptomyces sp. GC420]|uniref:alpha/beta hydrolase n=1 Tax=Streptomyces sp. GC420 TaxID=2697568 RepID=UPI001414FD51|nr:alpha/beta hydrolase [Streptomyces sp. GC420]NBM16461.1 hydrolase [Streptomyces sp. GC420]